MRERESLALSFVAAQEYVDRPFLINDRKFELRQYVLLCADGSGYTYNKALIRLASVKYSRDSVDR